MAAALPSAISNANRGVTFVHTRFWTTLNFGKFDLIEHFHRMLVTAPAADLGRFTAIRFRSARLRQNWEFARHTSGEPGRLADVLKSTLRSIEMVCLEPMSYF